jgi:TolB-like protein
MKTMPFVTILALAALAFAASDQVGFAQADVKKVAILELVNKAGLTDDEAAYLTDKVRDAASESLAGHGFLVITRESLVELLPPGTDLKKCTTASCEVEVGRQIGADYIVTGEILKFAGEFRANLKAHHSRSGAFLGAHAAEGATLKELEKAIEASSDVLFTKILAHTGVPPAPASGAAAPQAIVITPTELQLCVGDKTALTAKVIDMAGKEIMGKPIDWKTDRASVATVVGGKVIGNGEGVCTVTASWSTLSATAIIHVARAAAAPSSGGGGLGAGGAGPILRNGSFDKDLSYWTIGNPCDPNPNETPGRVSWTAAHGGSAHVVINGAPSAVCLVQHLIRDLHAGEIVEVKVYHTDCGNFTNWAVFVNGAPKINNATSGLHGSILCGSASEGFDTCAWTADADYPAGAEISLKASVWPGRGEYWWKSLAVKNADPSPPLRGAPRETWTDPNTGLMWQNGATVGFNSNYQNAPNYCRNLSLGGYSDWRLPTESELRSLIRGCPATQAGGSCRVSDSCSGVSCWNDICRGCSENGGPGSGGAYWPPEISGNADWYVSSSPVAGKSSELRWIVGFKHGDVSGAHLGYDVPALYWRCVRGGQ